jgi:hypothetical protein
MTDMIDEESIKRDYRVLSQLCGFLDLEALELFHFLANVLQNPEIPVLEIGVFCGRSLAGLACAFDKVPIVGVDPFFEDFYHSPAYEDEAKFLSWASNSMSPAQRKDHFWQVIDQLGSTRHDELKSRITLKQVTQESFLNSELGKSKFQACHLDGEHTFAGVRSLVDVFDELLVPNSWVIVDDLFNAGFPEISEAIHTHEGHRKSFWPVVFGFNKGVYLFRPDPPELLGEVKAELARAYSSSFYSVRFMRDNAIRVDKLAAEVAARPDVWSRLLKLLCKAPMFRSYP